MSPPFLQTRLALLYMAYFGAQGIFLPYWPVWLNAKGFETGQIALLLGIFPWLTVICGPLAGRIADLKGSRRTILRVLAVLFLSGYVLMAFASVPWQIIALLILIGASGAPYNAMVDTMTLMAHRAGKPVDYGRTRMWGSAAFILASSLGGLALGRFGEAAILYALIGAGAAMVLTGLAAPRLREVEDGRAPVPSADLAVAARPKLLGQPVFLCFLLAAACLQAQHGVLYMYGTLRWRAADVPDSVIGWLWAEGVLAEILLFLVGARILSRLGPLNLMLLSGLAGLVRWPMLAETTWLPALIVAQALHGFTFGAFHLGAMEFIRQAAPRGAAGAVQGIYAALVAGVASGLSIPMAGQLAGRFGPDAYWAMVLPAGTGLILLLWLRRRWDGARL